MRMLRAAFIIVFIMTIPKILYAQYTVTPTVYYLASQFTASSTPTVANLTGLAFSVNPNGNYHVTCHIIWQANISTAGPKYIWTGPNASTLTMFTNLFSPTGIASFMTAQATTYATTISNTTAIANVGTNFIDTIEFTLTNGSNTGTVQLQAGPSGAGTLTIQPTSNCIVQ